MGFGIISFVGGKFWLNKLFQRRWLWKRTRQSEKRGRVRIRFGEDTCISNSQTARFKRHVCSHFQNHRKLFEMFADIGTGNECGSSSCKYVFYTSTTRTHTDTSTCLMQTHRLWVWWWWKFAIATYLEKMDYIGEWTKINIHLEITFSPFKFI